MLGGVIGGEAVQEAVVAGAGGEEGVDHDRGLGLYQARAITTKHTIEAVPHSHTVHRTLGAGDHARQFGGDAKIVCMSGRP